MAMPGMQKPHCTPPHWTKESAICLRVSSGKPSSVVTDLPAACWGFIVQERRGLPSISRMQQPQDACGSQPFFNEVQPKSSRRMLRSERSSSSTTLTLLPFRLN